MFFKGAEVMREKAEGWVSRRCRRCLKRLLLPQGGGDADGLVGSIATDGAAWRKSLNGPPPMVNRSWLAGDGLEGAEQGGGDRCVRP